VSLNFEELKQRALELSAAERAELAQFLIESVDPVTENYDPVEIERAWLAEVKRRAAEVDRGEVQPIPGDEALTSVRQKLASRRD
jgi:putative addiction module component (TIGR02574 family)